MAQLLSNLPIGTKVKFGKYSVEGEPAQDITWIITAKSHSSVPAYPANSVTLLTDKIIDLRCFDSGEPVGTENPQYAGGNKRYSLSNIDQWLNKDSPAGQWYSPQHANDYAPSSTNTYSNTPYVDRPGFLNAFNENEKNAILNTNIRVAIINGNQSSQEDITRKVFLPSMTEVGLPNENNIAEGAAWVYFSTASRVAQVSLQAYTYTKSTQKEEHKTGAWFWYLRTPYYLYTSEARTVDTSGGALSGTITMGSIGVRPALNLSSLTSVSDNLDSEGCYTVVFNEAPPAPALITPPSTIYGGKSNTISWGIANDPDGDVVTYQLEASLDDSGFTQIYSGTSAAYAHLVPFGTSSVVYRVRAIDPSGESSAYTTSDGFSVVNNTAPMISGTDVNLGVKDKGFTGTYTITEVDGSAVTVTESIDGVQIRALVATDGDTITYGVTGNTWLALPNGSHTLTIRATDGIDTTVRTLVFTKLVDSFSIRNTTPWVSSTMPSRIMLVVTRNIPATATFKVEVCNNGYDTSPKWEDATDAVRSGLVHVFSNKSKTATQWGVQVRVTVDRNGATGACYISAIGGNFE